MPKESALSAHESVEIDDERTTVDGGADESGWEEQTVAEVAPPKPPTARGARRRPVSDDLITVDRSSPDDDDDEDATVRARGGELVRLATGTGEATVEDGTLDELTVEEQARPLPPLAPGLSRSAPVPRRDPLACRFIIESGNDAGRTLLLTGADVSVGRGTDNDLVLTDIAVSRRHFEVTFDAGRYTLRDLGSGNGTLINDRVEDGVCQLRHGDRIEFGNTVVRVDHPATQDDIPQIGWGGQADDDDDEPSTIAAQPRAKSAKEASAELTQNARRKRGTVPPPIPSKLVLPPRPPGASIDAMPTAPPVLLDGRAFGVGEGLAGDFPPAANLVAMPQAMYAGHDQLSLSTQLRPSDKKLFTGIIAGSIAIVVLAIGITVLRGGDEGEAVGSSNATGAATGEIGNKGAARAKGTKTRTPTAVKPGPRIAMATRKPASAASDLPTTTWGNQESELAAKFAKLPKRAATPTTATVPATTKATPTKATPTKATPVRARPTPKKRPPKAATRRRSAQGPGHKRIIARRRRVAVAPRPRPRRSASPKLAAAKKKAFGEYRRRRFAQGAAILRNAARLADNKNATKLRATAGTYERVGAALARAKSTESSNAVVSMGAYRRALALDRNAGRSAHATYIRIKLGAVAPRAAAANMVRKRYEAAKRACDAAANYGAGGHPTVRRVRAALSRKSAAFYKAAVRSYKKNPGYAKKLLRRAIAMVPPDDPSYAKPYNLLNRRKKRGRDADE